MATPDAAGEEPITGRDRLLILALINTLQPELDQVRRNLPPSFDRQRLETTLDVLDRRNLILRLTDDRCVVTVAGRATLGSGPIAKRRDVTRLLYLFGRSKGGRGEP